MPVHVHSRRGRQGGVRRARRHVRRPRCGGGRPGRCSSCCGRACSSATPACASSSPSAARSGPPTCSGRWTSPTTASTAPRSSASSSPPGCRCGRASTSTATAPSARRTPAGASWPAATRSASATSCGATTSPTPRAPGRTPASGCATPFCDIPVDETAQMLGLNAAEMYGFDVDALAAARRPGRPDARPSSARTGDDLAQVGRAARRRPALAAPASRRCPLASERDAMQRSPSTRSRPGSSRRPTTSTAGCEPTSRCTGRTCSTGGCSPATTTSRTCCASHSISSDLDNATPTGCRPSGAHAHGRIRQEVRHAGAARRPRARPPPAAHAGALRPAPIERAARHRCSARVDATLDRLRAARRDGADRRLRLSRCRWRSSARCSASPTRTSRASATWTAAVARSLDLVISEEERVENLRHARRDGELPGRAVEEKRRRPADDVLTELVQAEEAGDRLTRG